MRLPLVSCVMATMQSRRPFLGQALKYFLRQTYSPKELIVIADPGELPSDAISSSPEIRYLRTDTPLTLGGKLNFGMEAARGSIVQKLDDDDYYHPEFLSATAGALLAGDQRNSLVGCASYLILIAATGELKLRNSAKGAGGTFCFFKELWAKCPFRDVSLGEDELFLKDHETAHIGLRDPELYCYVRHNQGNTWAQWERPEQKEHGSVAAGENVVEYLRKLPAHCKTLKQYLPAEDLWFYESQIQNPRL